MSVRNLEYLFQPKSVAVVGASMRPQSVGQAVLRNLLEGGFGGAVFPVNPKHREVAGLRCYRNVADLPQAPDLAVLCTAPRTIPGLVAALGERGTRAIVILTAGLDAVPDGEEHSLVQQALAAAGAHGIRLLGPNCLGLILPPLGLNASFAPGMIASGRLAFISQSGALATAVADWARSKGIGFSHFVSLGNSADVDFGDLLDYLGGEPAARAILLYIESVKHARKFMSAARAAARNKPVVVVKAGRNPAGARAAASHTGALAGSDLVYDAAIRRAGMLRVATTEDLFDAVEALARGKRVRGDRLVVVTNGGGPGVMAADALEAGGGRLAELADATLQRLAEFLPPSWSRGNPVDLIGDALPERYREALAVLLEDPNSDALVFLHAPTAIVPSAAIAETLVPLLQHARLPVYACWMGGASVRAARTRFEQAGIPTFDSPEDAVGAFGQMVQYQRNQEQLAQTPPAALADFSPATGTARNLIAAVLQQGREQLTEPEAKAVLSAYGVPVVETRVAADVAAAVAAARDIGFPVALKILSPDISHKSDAGGVALGIESAAELHRAAEIMLERVAQARPEARLEGFTVQCMVRRPGAHELIAGASEDPVFGPVILFGQGGTAVEVIADRAVALPPLNPPLAAELVARTRVARLLAGYRNRPAADHDAICRTLVQLSQLLVDLPEVAELDINPLLADEHGVIALDARIRVAPARLPGAGRLAIMPYPQALAEERTFDGQPLTLRPIRPEDEPAHAEFLASLKPEDVRFRFFGLVREFPHSELARYTQIDYDREMAFIASVPGAAGRPRTLGVVRAAIAPDRTTAEFAIVIRSELKSRGLGHMLLEKMIRYCRERGVVALVGQTLAENQDMLALARRLGFEHAPAQEGVVNLMLALSHPASENLGSE
jgi:acetyltransferase